MAGPKKLGEMLKEAGLIDDMQLESALSHQRNWGGKLGSILIEMNLIREEDLARVIAEKLHFPHFDLFSPEVPEDIINLVKPEMAKKHGAIPVRKEARSLMVCMSDPLDLNAIDEIRFATGLSVKPCLALESEIKDALRKYYDHENVVHKPNLRAITKTEFAGSPGEVRQEAVAAKGVVDPSITSAFIDRAAKHHDLEEYSLRLNALISLLVEKKFMTREELAKAIDEKKMGK